MKIIFMLDSILMGYYLKAPYDGCTRTKLFKLS